MNMFVFEMRKIILRKSVILALIALVCIDIFKIATGYAITGNMDNDYKRGYWKAYNKVQGPMIRENIDFVVKGYKETSAIVKSGKYETKHKDKGRFTGYVFGDMGIFQELFNAMDYQYNYNSLMNKYIKRAEENVIFYSNMNNSYQLANNKKIMATYANRNISNFYDSEGFNSYFKYNFSSLLIIIMIILGLAPVFSYEREIEMDKLLLSSKYGRLKTELAKIVSALVFTILVSIIFFIVDFISFSTFYKLLGADNPIYSIRDFKLSPISIEIGQFAFLSGTLKILAFMVLSNIVLLFSSLFTDVLFPFILSSGTITSCILFNDFGDKNVLSFLNPVSLLLNRDLFLDYDVINLFGYPCYRFYVIIALVFLSLIMLIFLILFINKRDVVRHIQKNNKPILMHNFV